MAGRGGGVGGMFWTSSSSGNVSGNMVNMVAEPGHPPGLPQRNQGTSYFKSEIRCKDFSQSFTIVFGRGHATCYQGSFGDCQWNSPMGDKVYVLKESL